MHHVRSPGTRYGIVLGAFTIAATIRWALVPVFGTALPYITFYPAIMLCAWHGGFSPGVVMTLLGAVAVTMLWPIGSPLSAISILSMLLYLFNGVAISGLTELLHRARRRENELYEAAEKHKAEVERLLLQEHEARTAAESANRAKDDFLATLSHELRTPLNVILGWVSVLRRGRVDEAQLGRAIEVIARNTQMQAHLVNDLLDVSRIVAGKLSIDREEVDLLRLAQETIDGMQEHAAAKSLQITTQLDPDARWVLGDAVRLRQVISNLCSNAMKFTPPGGRVDVELARDKAHARLVIRDTGDGIEPHDLDRIFERFEQGTGNASGRRQGMGLGLAICRYLVNAHGGYIRAESAGKGRGATFTVDLPILTVRTGATPARLAERRKPKALVPRLDGFCVLVVDDHQDAREMVGTVLEQYGAEVLLAGSAQEALDAFSRNTVDILVSDVGMPQADGYDLIARLRALERKTGAPLVPAVALTAYGSKEDRERALSAGFHIHLVKPIDPVELGATIAEVAASRREARSLSENDQGLPS
ncbi:MAG TPA: ATP-binding protein [Burkholderiales bacterium]|nr:ATP-binding protein [Burkholderiales bacterium]